MSAAQELLARFGPHTPSLLGARYRCAVLCPVVENGSEARLLFEVRASSLRWQPGEVCFPGGRVEGNESDEDCALRETEEELGVPRSHITLLGKSDFLCNHSGFLMQPVLGLIDAEGLALLCPSPAEVEEVFSVPLSFFAKTPPEPRSYELEPRVPPDFPYAAVGIPTDYHWARGKVDVPIWHWDHHVIWGMTARIVRDIVGTLHEPQSV